MASDTPADSTEDKGSDPAGSAGPPDTQFSPNELQQDPATSPSTGKDVNLNLVLDVPVNVALRVGSTDISIRDLVRLIEGSVIALDQDADKAMDVLVNGTLIAHGEIVVVDEKFGVRLTDVVSPVERIENLN
jgi:flagellar motor switch protein FliN/FliY